MATLEDLQASLERLKSLPGPQTTPQVNPPHTLIGGPENLKLLFDGTMLKMMGQSPAPNGWEQLQQVIANDTANLARRVFNNAATIDYLLSMNAASAGQTGTTEGQAQVTPIRTGAADTQVQQPPGAVYPPIRNVDQGGATATNVAQASLNAIGAQVAALQDVVTKLADALVPVIVTAAGGASTPSQTTTKPPTSAS